MNVTVEQQSALQHPYFLYDLVAIWEWQLLPQAHVSRVLYTAQSASAAIRIPEICNCLFPTQVCPFPTPKQGLILHLERHLQYEPIPLFTNPLSQLWCKSEVRDSENISKCAEIFMFLYPISGFAWFGMNRMGRGNIGRRWNMKILISLS